MSTSTWIIGGVVAIVLFIYFRFKKKRGIPLLKVSVQTIDDYNYFVQFHHIHPDVKQIEYVRIALNFTTKILFLVRFTKPILKNEIIKVLNQVLTTKLYQGELEAIIGDKIKIKEGVANDESKTIEGTLYFINTFNRSINTKLPTTWHENQLLNSIIAVLVSCNNKIDESHKEYFFKSLSYLANSYNTGKVDPFSMHSMLRLPNEAFLAIYRDP